MPNTVFDKRHVVLRTIVTPCLNPPDDWAELFYVWHNTGNDTGPDIEAGRPAVVVTIDVDGFAYIHWPRLDDTGPWPVNAYPYPDCRATERHPTEHAVHRAAQLAMGYYHRWLRGRV